ncbi:hypothetical protein BDW02DRAFT_493396 [Decorospora gaudefroyi]|uniref:Uncharacterized protein n=1 Tax=Decorospora gaudefroyi TaxID=184978 RepID=A0A6A5KLR5_9PLEO|nr:hypothetical protein BDW02DRAFT_493396 [Decorospora gaudefroyi]
MLFLANPLASLVFLSHLLPVTTATPLHARAPVIPPPPADPPLRPQGDGIGPYDSEDAGWRDYLSKAKFFGIAATAGELGLTNAEHNMRHYLGNSGDEVTIYPENMMAGLPDFRTAAQALVQNEATAAYKSISTTTGSMAFSSKWSTYYATQDQSWDWYFAIGGFSYSVTGVVTKTSGGGSLQYQMHVFDRYNWDGGKFVDIGPFHFEDTELGNLHLKGLAREYIVMGSGLVNEVDSFTAGTVLAPPSTGGRN